MSLSLTAVNDHYTYCLHLPGDRDRPIPVKAHGMNVLFDPRRLRERSGRLHDLFDRLHAMLWRTQGGDYQVLCVDRDGRQWTTKRQIIDELFALGLALGRIGCLSVANGSDPTIRVLPRPR